MLTKLVKFVKWLNLGKLTQEKGTREAVNSMNAAKWQIQWIQQIWWYFAKAKIGGNELGRTSKLAFGKILLNLLNLPNLPDSLNLALLWYPLLELICSNFAFANWKYNQICQIHQICLFLVPFCQAFLLQLCLWQNIVKFAKFTGFTKL